MLVQLLLSQEGINQVFFISMFQQIIFYMSLTHPTKDEHSISAMWLPLWLLYNCVRVHIYVSAYHIVSVLNLSILSADHTVTTLHTYMSFLMIT